MKIGGFIPSSTIDYPGKISAVIFTLGCNFRCPFCHNPDLVTESLPELNVKDILTKIKERNKLIEGVVISGGEPLIQKDIIPFLSQIKKLGLKVKLDTNGYKAEVLEEIIDENLVDYIAMDLKAPYENYTINVGKVKINVTKIYWAIGLLMGSNESLEYEFRTTVLPEFTEQDIRKLGSMVRGAKKYVLQSFRNENTLNKMWKLKDPLSKETMEQYKKIMEEYVNEVELRV